MSGVIMSQTKVLVVDDDPTLALVVSSNIKARGFDVITANDGESALDLFWQVTPDIVVLDIALPGIDGFQVCRRIRKTSTAPIIMISAHAGHEAKTASLECGASDYIPKPFAIPDLMDSIKMALDGAVHNTALVDHNSCSVTVV